MFCRQCGKEVSASAHFCGYCGHEQQSGPAVGPTESQPAAAADLEPAVPPPAESPRPGAWWHRRRLWVPILFSALLLGLYLGWTLFSTTPSGILMRIALQGRSFESVSFTLRERESDLVVSGSLSRNGDDWASLIRTETSVLNETGFVESIDGEIRYYRERDGKWQSSVVPIGFHSPERADEVAAEFLRYLTDAESQQRWQITTQSGTQLITGRLPGDLIAYLAEGLYGREWHRLPPDGDFRLTVDQRSGRPMRLQIDAFDPPEFQMAVNLELSAWNTARIRLPSKLRPVARWPF